MDRYPEVSLFAASRREKPAVTPSDFGDSCRDTRVIPSDFGKRRSRRVRPWLDQGQLSTRRRPRVEACTVTLRAERLRRILHRPDLGQPITRFLAGGRYAVDWRLADSGRVFRVGYVLHAHPIQRLRVWLICMRCGRRCTRLYAPALGDALACRRCHGLAYRSQLRTYRPQALGEPRDDSDGPCPQLS